jgi:helix-turn-helix protein
MTCSDFVFSTELRRLRQAAGWSLADLSREIHYSKGYLSKVENSVKPINVDLARRCDAALGAGGRLSALASRALTVGHQDVASSLTGGASIDATHTQAVPAPDDSVVVHVTELFMRVRLLGREVSPRAVLPMVAAQVNALQRLACDAPERLRRQLLMLAGRHAEYAAWMSQESGAGKATLAWLDTAMRLAEQASDTDLRVYLLVRRAGVTLYLEDAQATVTLAQVARRGSVAPWLVRAARLREAQGHALAGEARACRLALDKAADLVTASCEEVATPSLGSASATESAVDQHALVSGWCFYDLGEPAESAKRLDQVLTESLPSGSRAATRFAVRRALAYSASGELERSCSLVAQLLPDVQRLDSATIRLDLRRLHGELGRQSAHPLVRELRPLLARAGRSRVED